VLRALGLTPREVWRLSAAQSGLMGVVSGALALPVGLCLAGIMIFVINRRSFGWTLEMSPAPAILVEAFLLALVASLAAGLYPARRMSATRPATALREE
jgi:putative ABC transport system permease protein